MEAAGKNVERETVGVCFFVSCTVSCWCQFFIHIIMPNVSAKIFIQMKMPPAKKRVKITNSRRKWGTVLRENCTIESQTILKQLQTQPLKHPCTLWGIHLQDMLLPWQQLCVRFLIGLSFTSCNFPSSNALLRSRKSIPTKFIKQSSKYSAFLSVEV